MDSKGIKKASELKYSELPDYVKNKKKERRKNKTEEIKVNDYLKPLEEEDYKISDDKFSVCKKCGKTFKQEYLKEQERYQQFDTCHACRWKLAEESRSENQKEKILNRPKQAEEVMQQTATIKFTPYEWQKKARENFRTHRFSVWAIGNRAGKDFCANMVAIEYFIECLNENRHILEPEMSPSVLWWIIAPTEDMAKQNWRDLKKQFPKQWIVNCSDSAMQMETINGGVIEVKSAYNPESLVGVALDLVTITEAARIDYNKSGSLALVWANVEARLNSQGKGLSKDRKGAKYGAGKAIINSSPLGKNFFYEMFLWGQSSSEKYDSNWISIQEPWTCNPANAELAKTMVKTKYGLITYEESLKRRIGTRKYNENYCASFEAGDGTVFKEFEENCVKNLNYMDLTDAEKRDYLKSWKMPIKSHSYRIGYDPASGSSGDDPVIIVRDLNTNKLPYVKSLYGLSYEQQYDKIAEVSRVYNYAECAWLRTGHTAIENQLAKRGVLEVPLNEQGGKKIEYIQSLENAVENFDIEILGDGSEDVLTLIAQMNDYTEIKKGRYSNKTEAHDDFVCALYACYYDYGEREVPTTAGCLMMGYVD